MHAQIALETPYSVFTNLDVIKGKALLRLQSPTPLTSVVVKLEGEARTRLMSPGNKEGGERPRPREEVHKVLYRVQQLLPKTTTETAYATTPQHHVLQPGLHEWPFEFKLPFNNACVSSTPTKDVSFAGLSLQMVKTPLRHVKATLPPTLTTYPGMCEVRYYIKVTVNRKEFYKENPRVFQPFNFIPIEPPRPPSGTAENYARRQHQFQAIFGPKPGPSKLKSLFTSSKESPSATSSPVDSAVPKISFDARLPEPAIFTCNEDVPLRLIVKRTNSSTESLYLQSLHIELVASTAIRAQDVFRNETSSIVIVSQSNMNVLLDAGSEDPKALQDKEIVIDAALWQGKPVPNTITPSFDACNITRRYNLEVRAGIGYGSDSIKNLVVLPLRLPVAVYSGIKPPAALLDAMQRGGAANRRSTMPNIAHKPVTKKPVPGQAVAGSAAAVSTTNQPASPASPVTPVTPVSPHQLSNLAPLRPGPDEGIEEPPPTYEEAIADDLAPIDGPRNYQPPPVASGSFPLDEKR